MEGNRALTFLPLAHVLSRAVSLAATLGGATQSHWSDMSTLVPEFARVVRASTLKPEQVAVISFNEPVIVAIKEQMPEVKAFFLYEFKQQLRCYKSNLRSYW